MSQPVVISSWCKANSWFRDNIFTDPNKAIPKDEINDIIIQDQKYTFYILNNQCFSKIPSLTCNDLEIQVSKDAFINPTARAAFNCEILDAADVTVGIGKGVVDMVHWNSDTYCQHTMSSLFLSSGTVLDKIICQIEASSGTGLVAEECSIKNSVILSESIYLGPGSKISCDNDNFPTRIISESGTLFGATTIASNTQLYGNFYIFNSNIDTSGIGKFLLQSSTVGSSGVLEGEIKLSHGSSNKGNIYANDVIFSGSGTTNYGLVSGNCIFLSGAINSGSISGFAVFNTGCFNYGTVAGEAYFYSSINSGVVENLSLFYNSDNYGTLNNDARFYDSKNYGSIINDGQILFENSKNYSNLIVSKVQFNKRSRNESQGMINADNIIFSSGFNYGSGLSKSGVIFFQNSGINYGYLQAKTVNFFDISENTGTIHSPSDSVGGTIINFLDSSTNFTSITGITSDNSILNFKNKSKNYGDISISGSGSTCNFYDKTINYASINMSHYYNSSINSGILTTGCFYDTSKNMYSGGSSTDLYFCNRSINSGLFIGSTFRDNSTNFGSGTSGNFFNRSINASSGTSKGLALGYFYDQSINNKDAKVTGLANFYNNSINFGIENLNPYNFFHLSTNEGYCELAVFSGFSKNNNYARTGTFYQTSFNNNKGSGNYFKFYDQSYNKGFISHTGIFYDNSINESSAFVQNAIFSHTGINRSSFSKRNSKSPDPVVRFSDSSINDGAIVDSKVEFWDSSINANNIKYGSTYVFREDGIFQLNDNRELQHISEDLSSDTALFLSKFSSFPILEFRDKTINSGNVIGYQAYNFFNESHNLGNISTFSIIPEEKIISYFSGNSLLQPCMNYGNIMQGRSNFYSTINSGNVIADKFNHSFNYGLINSCKIKGFDVIYLSGSVNSGLCNGNTIFIDSLNYGNLQGSGTFSTSLNFAFVRDGAFFDRSYNSGTINNSTVFISGINSGLIRGQSTFYSSMNSEYGIIEQDSVFISGVNYGFIRGNAILIASNNTGILEKNAIFNYSGINGLNGVVKGNASFNGFGTVNAGTVEQTAIFTTGGENYGNIRKGLFDGSGAINLGIIYQDAIFISGAGNYGKIFDSATFDMLSCTGIGSEIYGAVIASGIVPSCG
jgi:hypothetical protein